MTNIPDPDVVPLPLKTRNQWVCWRYERRHGDKTKIPVDPTTGSEASSTDPSTWASFDDAMELVDHGGAHGVGFVFSDQGMIAGVDLDNCRDPDTGSLEPWAHKIVDYLDSYTHVSPSGKGLHVFVLGFHPGGDNRSGALPRTLEALEDGKDGEIEMYDSGRFFTFTGDRVNWVSADVERRNARYRDVHEQYVESDDEDDSGEEGVDHDAPDLDLTDEELLKRARRADYEKDQFSSLYDYVPSDSKDAPGGYKSRSEAEMALCCLLAWWTGKDQQQMDRLFRNSGLMREKWDADRGKKTYGEMTLEAACSHVNGSYDPNFESNDETEEATAQ